MGVSQLLGARARAPPKVYAYDSGRAACNTLFIHYYSRSSKSRVVERKGGPRGYRAPRGSGKKFLYYPINFQLNFLLIYRKFLLLFPITFSDDYLLVIST